MEKKIRISAFIGAGAVLLKKIDLLGLLDYNFQQVKPNCLAHNHRVNKFMVSTKTRPVFDQWFACLKEQRQGVF